jgi:C4-dicarboxylate-specific signal transduction histidine kinase
MAEEQAAMDGRGAARPKLGRRIYTFVCLLVLSAYPAFWDRRRAHLKRREGIVRTELRARRTLDEELTERVPEGEEVGAEEQEGIRRLHATRRRARDELIAAHEQRPDWVRDYIDRVGREEWVDE